MAPKLFILLRYTFELDALDIYFHTKEKKDNLPV